MIYVLEEDGDATYVKIGYAKSRDERILGRDAQACWRVSD